MTLWVSRSETQRNALCIEGSKQQSQALCIAFANYEGIFYRADAQLPLAGAARIRC